MRGGCEECRHNWGKDEGEEEVLYIRGRRGRQEGEGKKRNSPMKIRGGEEIAVHRNRLEENDAIT